VLSQSHAGGASRIPRVRDRALVEREVRKSGFSVIRELGGHGIDAPSTKLRTFHYAIPRSQVMKEDCHPVEPIISSGSGRVFTDMTVGRTYRRSLPIGPFRANARDYFGIPLLLTAG